MGTTTKNQFSCRVGLYAPDIILLSNVLLAASRSSGWAPALLRGRRRRRVIHRFKGAVDISWAGKQDTKNRLVIFKSVLADLTQGP
jgi:hypothetical protein